VKDKLVFPLALQNCIIYFYNDGIADLQAIQKLLITGSTCSIPRAEYHKIINALPTSKANFEQTPHLLFFVMK
jgi:hypothetical protein